MTKCILGLAAVLLAVLAPGASAEPFTPELEAAYETAISEWGQGPPSQCMSVTKEIVAGLHDSGDGHRLAGEATQPAAGATGIECFLRIDPAVAQAPCQMREIVRHEVGHLLGYGHSSDPNSWMASTASGAECVAEGRAAKHLSELRMQRLAIWGRCLEFPPDAGAARHCWRRARRATAAVLATEAISRDDSFFDRAGNSH